MTRNFVHTAKSALQRDIKFWETECGYTKEQIEQQIKNWKPFGFGFSETNDAIKFFLNEVTK